MNAGRPDVPDWIEEKIEVRNNREVQDHYIVDVFQNEERPFLSVSKVASELGMTTEGARPRLNHLDDIDVLDSCPGANGQVYWIHDDRSKWPIPPDVEVVSAPEEPEDLTVSEFTSRLDVRFAAGAAGSALLGSFSILIALAITMTNSSFYGTGDSFFLFGMVISLVSASFIALAVLTWGYRQLEKKGWVTIPDRLAERE